MARPKEDISTLPEGWHQQIIELYREGGCDVEAKAMIHDWRSKFSNNLWDRWMEEEPEFWETIKKGRELSAAWWLREGRTSLREKDFNSTLWYMNMKNRFGWADRQQTDHTTQGEKITQTIVVQTEADKKEIEKI